MQVDQKSRRRTPCEGANCSARCWRFRNRPRQRRRYVTAVTRKADAAIGRQSSRLILVLHIIARDASTIIQWRMSMTVWEAAAAATAFLLRSGPNDDWR